MMQEKTTLLERDEVSERIGDSLAKIMDQMGDQPSHQITAGSVVPQCLGPWICPQYWDQAG